MSPRRPDNSFLAADSDLGEFFFSKMISNFDLRILFWCVLSLSVLTNGQTDCVRISNCPAYSWLENSENKSGFSARDIIRQINRIHCRWEGLNRLIHCPAGSVVEGKKELD
jgi:hypothetical protein